MKLREGAANPTGPDGKPVVGPDGKPKLGLMARYMEANRCSQARLGRHADVSRQFIHQLVTGQKTTCHSETGKLIEEALRVLPGTLFVEHKSSTTRPRVASRRRAPAGSQKAVA